MSPDPASLDAATAANLQESFEGLLERIAITPNDPTLHHALGTVLCARGDLGLGLEAFAHAVTLRPTYAEAHVGRGLTLENLGQMDEARKAFATCM